MVTIDAGSEWGVGGGTMCTRRVTRVARGIRGPSAAPSPLLYPILDCTTAPARRVHIGTVYFKGGWDKTRLGKKSGVWI